MNAECDAAELSDFVADFYNVTVNSVTDSLRSKEHPSWRRASGFDAHRWARRFAPNTQKLHPALAGTPAGPLDNGDTSYKSAITLNLDRLRFFTHRQAIVNIDEL